MGARSHRCGSPPLPPPPAPRPPIAPPPLPTTTPEQQRRNAGGDGKPPRPRSTLWGIYTRSDRMRGTPPESRSALRRSVRARPVVLFSRELYTRDKDQAAHGQVPCRVPQPGSLPGAVAEKGNRGPSGLRRTRRAVPGSRCSGQARGTPLPASFPALIATQAEARPKAARRRSARHNLSVRSRRRTMEPCSPYSLEVTRP